MTSRTQRIVLSGAALAIALLIAVLHQAPGPAPAPDAAPAGVEPAPSGTQVHAAKTRAEAVAHAVRWLQRQEGGAHRGHAIARHVGKSEADLRARLATDDISAASTFYDLETAAVAIVRTIRHPPHDAQVRRWLGDGESRRRLALRRAFEAPIGRIVRRSGGAEDGRSAVAVLVKWRDGDRTGYRLLTAYVEP